MVVTINQRAKEKTQKQLKQEDGSGPRKKQQYSTLLFQAHSHHLVDIASFRSSGKQGSYKNNHYLSSTTQLRHTMTCEDNENRKKSIARVRY